MKKISRFDGKVISVVSMEKTGEKKLSFFLVDRTGKYWLLIANFRWEYTLSFKTESGIIKFGIMGDGERTPVSTRRLQKYQFM